MSGNTIGKLFTVTSFGESHGPAIGAIVDGCPPGMELSEADIQPYLDKRRPGTTRHHSPRREPDEVKILSGVFEGLTTGAPIGLLIENVNQKSKDYGDIKDKFRPGTLTTPMSINMGYGIIVAAAALPLGKLQCEWLRVLSRVNTWQNRRVLSFMVISSKWARLSCQCRSFGTPNENPFFCADPARISELEDFLDALRKEGDSIGARINVIARGLPPGLGEPIFDRLEADLAHALMGINAVKAVEFGDGFLAASQKGTEHRDELTPTGFRKNSAGGVLGGISTGQDMLASIALKPTSSLRIPGDTIDVDGNPTEIITKGRHDPCVGLRATPIAEAMCAIVILDHYLRQRGQNGDVECRTPDIAKR